MLFDTFHRKILSLLQRDCRQSLATLAEEAGLSTTPCWRRIKDLEGAGVIRGYAALVDRRKVGLNVCVFVQIRLERLVPDLIERFTRDVSALSEVVEAYETSGEYDFILKVVVPDIDAYNAFQHAKLVRIAGVAQYNSTIALREVKYETALPIDSA